MNPEWIAYETERLISTIKGIGIFVIPLGCFMITAALIIKGGLTDYRQSNSRGEQS